MGYSWCHTYNPAVNLHRRDTKQIQNNESNTTTAAHQQQSCSNNSISSGDCSGVTEDWPLILVWAIDFYNGLQVEPQQCLVGACLHSAQLHGESATWGHNVEAHDEHNYSTTEAAAQQRRRQRHCDGAVFLLLLLLLLLLSSAYSSKIKHTAVLGRHIYFLRDAAEHFCSCMSRDCCIMIVLSYLVYARFPGIQPVATKQAT